MKKIFLIILFLIFLLNISACGINTTIISTYEVVFKIGNQETKIVLNEGESLSIKDERVPSLPIETGYEYYWNKDIKTINSSMTLTALKKGKTYTVTVDPNGGFMDETRFLVTYGEIPNIAIPTSTSKASDFAFYMLDGVEFDLNKEWNIDHDVTLKAFYKEGTDWSDIYE